MSGERPPNYNIDEIVQYCREHPGLTVKELSEKFPMVAPSTVYKDVVARGITFTKQIYPPPESRDELVAMLRKHRGDVTALSRELGMKTRNPVRDWCEQFGVNPKAIRGEIKAQEKQAKSRRAARSKVTLVALPGPSVEDCVPHNPSVPDPNSNWLSKLLASRQGKSPRALLTTRDIQKSENDLNDNSK